MPSTLTLHCPSQHILCAPKSLRGDLVRTRDRCLQAIAVRHRLSVRASARQLPRRLPASGSRLLTPMSESAHSSRAWVGARCPVGTPAVQRGAAGLQLSSVVVVVLLANTFPGSWPLLLLLLRHRGCTTLSQRASSPSPFTGPALIHQRRLPPGGPASRQHGTLLLLLLSRCPWGACSSSRDTARLLRSSSLATARGPPALAAGR